MTGSAGSATRRAADQPTGPTRSSSSTAPWYPSVRRRARARDLDRHRADRPGPQRRAQPRGVPRARRRFTRRTGAGSSSVTAGTRRPGPSTGRPPARSSTGRPTAESSTSPASTCTRRWSPRRCWPPPRRPAAVGFHDSGHLSTEAHHVVRRVARESVGPDQRRTLSARPADAPPSWASAPLHELGGPDISSEDDFRAMLALAAEEPVPDVIGYWGELGGVERARELGALGAPATSSPTAPSARTLPACAASTPTTTSPGTPTSPPRRSATTWSPAPRLGFRPGFHAIGDGALDAVARGLPRGRRAGGRRRRPPAGTASSTSRWSTPR